jgi:hypothetical protein
LTDPVFVFGSNLAGRHGKGAALDAVNLYGAVRGVSEGMTGHSYALPTKDAALRPLPLADIEAAIVRFLDYAKSNRRDAFLLTPVGCGLAGHSKRSIWAILQKHGVPENVYLASSWVSL